jgi:hypothetical protein
MAKKSKKVQGHKAPTGQESDVRMKPKAEHQDRGIGSSFAMAVSNVLEESKQLKGSQSSFLGVASETLDIKDQSHSLGKK